MNPVGVLTITGIRGRSFVVEPPYPRLIAVSDEFMEHWADEDGTLRFLAPNGDSVTYEMDSIDSSNRVLIYERARIVL